VKLHRNLNLFILTTIVNKDLLLKQQPIILIGDPVAVKPKIFSQKDILRYDFQGKQEILTSNYLPHTEPVNSDYQGCFMPDELWKG
jgi:hypothetical protein